VYGEGQLQIDKNVCFNSNTRILCRDNIHIGKDTMFGPNCVIIDYDHDYMSKDWRNKYKTSSIEIESNVGVGANVVILRGTIIEDNCVIGAGMIAKGIYKANTIYYADRNVKFKQIVR